MNIKIVRITGLEYKMLQGTQALMLLVGIAGILTLYRYYPHFTLKMFVEMVIIIAVTYGELATTMFVARRMSRLSPHVINGVERLH